MAILLTDFRKLISNIKGIYSLLGSILQPKSLDIVATFLNRKDHKKSRVLEDILENNPYYHLSDERKQRIKALFKGYKNLTGAMRQELLSLGFEISEAGKHYKITYHGDSRYMVTLGKTPSDNRSGSNNAALISKTML